MPEKKGRRREDDARSKKKKSTLREERGRRRRRKKGIKGLRGDEEEAKTQRSARTRERAEQEKGRTVTSSKRVLFQIRLVFCLSLSLSLSLVSQKFKTYLIRYPRVENRSFCVCSSGPCAISTSSPRPSSWNYHTLMSHFFLLFWKRTGSSVGQSDSVSTVLYHCLFSCSRTVIETSLRFPEEVSPLHPLNTRNHEGPSGCSR